MTVASFGGVPGAGTAAAAAVQKIRLKTSIMPGGQMWAGDVRLATYVVTVRATGGTAHGTWLAVATQQPARWSSFPASCHASEGPSDRLSCALGEVKEPARLTMTLQLPAGSRIPGRLSVVALADAANAVKHRAAGAVVVVQPWAAEVAARATPSPSGSAVASASAAPEPAAGPAKPHKRKEPAGTEREREPVPLVRHHPEARPLGSPRSPSAKAALRLPAVPAVTPPRLSAPAMPTGPRLPAIDQPFVAPPVPALPQTSNGPRMPDDAQMSLLTMPPTPGGRESWAKALAVVVIAEAALLWLAASLGLWRRRLLVGHAVGQAVGQAMGHAVGQTLGRLPRPAATLVRALRRLRTGRDRFRR